MGAHQSTCSGAEGRRLLKAAEDGCLPAVDARVTDNPSYVCFSSLSGGNTMWHKAAKAGRLGVLKALAAAVSAAYAGPKGTEEAAHLSVLLRLGGRPEDAVRRLVNALNFKRCTPLMLAAGHGHADVVEWLLQRGAVLMVHDRIRNQTALHYAVQGGSAQCVRLILNAASHVAPTDAEDATPRRRQPSPCPPLSERQLLLAASNHAGLTALHYAVHEDAHDAARLLLAHGADVNAQAEYPDLDFTAVNAGDTPLHIAASRGSIEAIHVLLKGFVETSGLLCPEHAPPRHIRDPRGVRNDYGRLPYHLAMRRRFTWLAELLDPSVPIRYLLTGEEPDTGAAFGPPRLATIAAKALHEKLLRELAEIKAASGGGFGSACGQGGGSSCNGGEDRGAGDAPLIPNSLQRAQAEQAAATAAATGGQPWRLWQLGSSGRRRSSDSGVRDGTAAEAQAAQAEAGPGGVGAGGVSPRRLLPGSAAAAAAMPDRRGTPPPTFDGCSSPPPPPRSLGLSPRIGLEGSATPAPGRSRRASCDGSVTPAAVQQAPSLAAAIAHVAASLGPAAPLLGAKEGDAGSAAAAAGEVDTLAVQLLVSSELEPLSDASEAGSCSDGGAQDRAAQAAACKVSPLSADVLGGGDGQALLRGLARGGAAHAAASDGRRGSLDSCCSDVTCGVCLDAPPATCILPCAHVMCVDCALDMTKRYSLGTAACPFCRALVAGFRPAARHEMRQQ